MLAIARGHTRVVLVVLLAVFVPLMGSQAADVVAQEQDEERLLRTALESENDREASEAAGRIKSPALLRRVALKANSMDARLAATDLISDQAVLRELVMPGNQGMVRWAAIAKLDDPKLLTDFVLHNKDEHIRGEATRRLANAKLVDQSLLFELALKDRSLAVRHYATSGISEPRLLRDLALRSDEADIRREAVERLDDPTVWEALSKRERDAEVQLQIMKKTNEAAVLVNLAAMTDDARVGVPIVVWLRDPTSWRRVASQSRSEATRQIARLRLFLDDPLLKERGSELEFRVVVRGASREYATGPYGLRYSQLGEDIKLDLVGKAGTVASFSWIAKFPYSVSAKSRKILPAAVDVRPVVDAAIESLVPAEDAVARKAMQASFAATAAR